MSLPLLRAGIAMGSNIEPCLERLQEAIEFLRGLNEEAPFLLSSIYKTEPVDCEPGTPPFLNAVAEISTSLGPRELLHRLQTFEILQGRPEDHGKNTPRTMDLDILYVGTRTSSDPDLILPHPRAAERAFVMVPLAEIRPTLTLPGQAETVQTLSSRLKSEDLQVILCP
ncbi:MAG: 2-amino-4-hydroxy-6-hydroxymethyldihydropteridine diphosphokinase [Terrimicrobiaceae bacterium]